LLAAFVIVVVIIVVVVAAVSFATNLNFRAEQKNEIVKNYFNWNCHCHCQKLTELQLPVKRSGKR